jgi:hypothetical protein
MDLTFVDVFEKKGLDAPAASFAAAFAGAKYPLWHANQMARYDILNGLFPPESGHWLKNPHADDIDFQIEADFAGLMSPGIPTAPGAASESRTSSFMPINRRVLKSDEKAASDLASRLSPQGRQNLVEG